MDSHVGAIPERQWAETLLAGENRLLEMVARGRPLTDVLNALCSFVEESTDCICGVYLIDWNGPVFRNGAAPSLPESYTAPIDGLAVTCAVAPCGTAALLKTQVIVPDLGDDPRWNGSPYQALVPAHGLRAVWSTPIYALEGSVLGTFAVYERQPGIPSQRQHDLIAQVTHIASIAIERAQREAALKRSEGFLREAQRLSRTGSFSWRVATNEIMLSEEAYRIYEIEPGVKVTLDLLNTRVHPENQANLKEVIHLAKGEGGNFDYESRLLMPDNRIKYLHVVAHSWRSEDGELELIGTVHDITQSRIAEDALSKLRSELSYMSRAMSLGTLTASIAHEVNQPLSGIITNASTCLRMLGADPPNIDGARETARRTIRDGNRASEVVARLRGLFANKNSVAESVDLNDATREVIALSSSELKRFRVKLRVQFAENLPSITGDRIQLQQVILNLLRNATEAMKGVTDRPRQLVIRTERDRNGARVTVQDAGVGFEPRGVEKLFDPFYTT